MAELVVMGTVVTGEVEGSATVPASFWGTHTMTMTAATIVAAEGFAGIEPDSPLSIGLPDLLWRSGFIYSASAELFSDRCREFACHLFVKLTNWASQWSAATVI
ncbi:hypothetical protein HYPDE_34823 [Hyphomicrobium denitrificans 1NES1]|uniref:Uncharacterized protein n=1 Tax=Hyphomicrobium denitrificans 1NES1 TaxID=670307 RepID=N0BDR7_9HYPH|nr:hypothetical protein HYPDE_34823 [Hyphomicrobium denitrificans 1NES1]